jgi:hypothetical protein
MSFRIAILLFLYSLFIEGQVVPINCLYPNKSSVIKVDTSITQIHIFQTEYIHSAEFTPNRADLFEFLQFIRDSRGCYLRRIFFYARNDSVSYRTVKDEMVALSNSSIHRAQKLRKFVETKDISLLFNLYGLGLNVIIAKSNNGKYYLVKGASESYEIKQVTYDQIIEMIKKP